MHQILACNMLVNSSYGFAGSVIVAGFSDF